MKDYKHKEIITFNNLQFQFIQIYLTINLELNKVLLIGKRKGFVSSILEQYCDLYTLDFNESHNSDFCIDISDFEALNTLNDNEYDIILICSVLEHIPYEKIENILKILKRKTKKYIILSVPNQTVYINILFFKKGLGNIGNIFKKVFYIFSQKIENLISKLDYKFRKKNRKFSHCGYSDIGIPHHYWELGEGIHSVDLFKKLLRKYFIILKEQRMRDNPIQHFFIIKKIL